MAERVLIWGAGAMGGTLGAYLKRAGHDVTFVDLNAAHVAAMRDPARGLRIVGPIEEFTIAVPSLLPSEVSGQWPCILLAVKAHDTEPASRALAPHLAPDGCVVSIQNGLNEKIIAAIVGAERTVGAFVNYAADWLEPGKIIYGARGAVTVGELDGRITPRLERLAAMLRDFEPNAAASADIWSDLWSKSAFGAILFAQAAVKQPMAECYSRPELLPVWRLLIGEVVQAAQAEGVRLHSFDGFDPEAFLPRASEAASAASIAATVENLARGAKPNSGPWRDIAIHGRRTGADVMMGQIVAIGESHGLTFPGLRRLIAMIGEIEAGRRAQSDDNLLEFLRSPH